MLKKGEKKKKRTKQNVALEGTGTETEIQTFDTEGTETLIWTQSDSMAGVCKDFCSDFGVDKEDCKDQCKSTSFDELRCAEEDDKVFACSKFLFLLGLEDQSDECKKRASKIDCVPFELKKNQPEPDPVVLDCIVDTQLQAITDEIRDLKHKMDKLSSCLNILQGTNLIIGRTRLGTLDINNSGEIKFKDGYMLVEISYTATSTVTETNYKHQVALCNRSRLNCIPLEGNLLVTKQLKDSTLTSYSSSVVKIGISDNKLTIATTMDDRYDQDSVDLQLCHA